MKLLAAVLLLTCALQAQTPPLDLKDRSLVATELDLRMMDLISTHNALTNPCKCFEEKNPIAPHSANWGKQLLFQGGMAALVIGGSHFLKLKHHPKWANALLMGDIASESWAVQNNLRLEPPK